MKNAYTLFLRGLCAPGFAILLAAGAHAQTSPYAGQQQRSIKALSDEEVEAFLEGKGSGYAKAAELNDYPGPMHVLELADKLHLSNAQREKTQTLLHAHKEEVRMLGTELVNAERDLDLAFAEKRIDHHVLRQKMTEIAVLQSDIRHAHLRTHLEQTALLSHHQIARYSVLRGYAQLPGSSTPHHSTH